MLGIRRGFLRRYSNFWKKLTEVLISLCSVRSMANYSTSSPGKMGHFFDQLCQAGLTGRNCGCHPDFFNTAFTALFERNVSEMLLCVILFPHLWYHKKICSSVAHHYLCISKIHQKDLRWNVEDPCHSVSPVNPCVRRGTDACERAVGGVGSATPE